MSPQLLLVVLLLLAAAAASAAALPRITRPRKDRPVTDTTSTTPGSEQLPELDRYDRRDAVEQHGREAARQLWCADSTRLGRWKHEQRWTGRGEREPLAGELDVFDPGWADLLDRDAVEQRAVQLWRDARAAEQRAAADAAAAARHAAAANACRACGEQRDVTWSRVALPAEHPADRAELCQLCAMVASQLRLTRMLGHQLDDGRTRGAAVERWLSS